MNFEKEYLYHVYNRGNNGEKLFYSNSNYYYFIEKLEYYLLPYADVLAWCLMPNHFHLMIYIHRSSVFSLTINQSFGKMLSSYARSINQQESRTGSLFQQHSKARCLNDNTRLKPSWFKTMGAAKINSWNEKPEYPRICLEYIHMNPVVAGIVIDLKDWKWSSYHEIFNNSGDIRLVNLERLKMVLPL
jgi:putative transposase